MRLGDAHLQGQGDDGTQKRLQAKDGKKTKEGKESSLALTHLHVAPVLALVPVALGQIDGKSYPPEQRRAEQDEAAQRGNRCVPKGI